MVLVIDNYDSFTYNLVQYLGELGAEVQVVRNDAVTLDDVVAAQARADRDFAGAGPARGGGHHDGRDPASSGRRRRFSASAWGIRRSARCSAARSCAPRVPMHGKTSTIEHDGRGVFTGIDRAVRRLALPLAGGRRGRAARRSSRCRRGRGRTRTIMGLRHRDVAGARRAVSSRIDPDRRGHSAFCGTFSAVRSDSTCMFPAADRKADAARRPDDATRPPPRWPR